jgi:tRNA dimethylallyltransferase
MLHLPKTNSSKPKIISIIGTTGVGKSQLSIELAQRFNGEIINADSMQMYTGLDNITNKHPIEERNGIIHHVMNHINWDETYYIHKFKNECELAINDIWNRGKIPILVGGTHYYLQSVLFDNKTIGSNDIDQNNEQDVDYSKLTDVQRNILETNDNELLFEQLKLVDPEISNKFHPNDIRRIKRALEVFYVTGEKASSVYKKQREQMANTGTSLKYDTLFFWIYSKNKELNERLDMRVDKMMQNGGLKELIDLYEFYKSQNNVENVDKMDSGVWQVIGFKEFLPYLETNGIQTLQDIDNIEDEEQRRLEIDQLINDNDEFKRCCDEMKLKTRKYAKKQVKWIKNLLGPELQEEEDNGFVKFGKIYILDATGLKIWNQQVLKRGETITNEFIQKRYVNDDEEQIPSSLKEENLLVSKQSSLNKIDNWKHYQCDICRDRITGKPLVYVGEQWEIHLKSKKHKFNLNRGKRKREYEEWLKANRPCPK